MRARATMHLRQMNRLEEKYARHLQDRLITGEIRWYLYEAWKFRLADNTTYTPDFIVVDNALRIEAHEVKAQWSTGKAGWKDDSRAKIKIAAEMHPVRFIAATFVRDGNWEFEEFLSDREEPVPSYEKQVGIDAIKFALEALKAGCNADEILKNYASR